jgi:hypothetical protein
MDPKQLKPQPGYFEQLALDLVVEDDPTPSPSPFSSAENGERRVAPSPEEARLRSEVARQQLEGEAKQAWMEEYLQLRTAGWPWRVAAYIAWAASPRIGRRPGSIDELAKNVLGLTGPRQIHHWRETNPAIDEVVGVLQAAPLMQHRRDVMDALSAAASDKDHRNNPDRKLYLEIIGDYVPKAKVDISRDAEDLSQYSDAELDLLARKAMKKINHGVTENTEEDLEKNEGENGG